MKFLDRATHMALKAAQKIASGRQGKVGKARPAELLLLLPLSADESEYQFSLDHDRYEQYPIARGLAYRNGFNAVAMAVGIMPVKVKADGTEMFGGSPVIYYPDAQIFSEPAGGADEFSEAETLNCIYNGQLEVQTNEGVRLDRFLMNRFYTAETTQSSATTVNESIGTEANSLGGVLRFKGGDDNFLKVRFHCKDKTLIAGTATRKNYLAIRLIGAEIKGDTTSRLANG